MPQRLPLFCVMQEEVRQVRRLETLGAHPTGDPDKMSALRIKFIKQAKQYFGVPYKRKYWAKDSKSYLKIAALLAR